MSFLQFNMNRLTYKSLKITIFCSYFIYGSCLSQNDILSKVKPILDQLNYTVDPCDDFYDYVCGYMEKIELPKTSSRMDKFQTVFEDTAEQMMKLVSEDIDPEEPETFKLMKKYYQSCMDITSIENRKFEPLQEILSTVGGWPILLGNNWNEENFSWVQTDITLKSSGFNPKYLFHIHLFKHEYDTSKNILSLDVAETDIRNLRHHDDLLRDYMDYIINIAILLGANESYAETEAKESFEFEWNLWSISHYLVPGIPEHMMTTYVSIDELQYKYPYVQWLEYLNNMTFPVTLNKTDIVRLENPSYMYAMKDLLRKTPKRVIANYMVWRAIDSSIQYLHKELRDKQRSFSKNYNGISESRPRDEECIRIMMNFDRVEVNFDNALIPGISAMYLKNYYKKSSFDKIEEIISVFRETYEKIIEKSWLDDGTKVRALRKIALMKNVFGIHNEILDLNFMDDYYKNVHLTSNKFFENSMEFHKFYYKKSMINLKKSPNETLWFTTPVAGIVTAYYDLLNNAMAPLMQYPHYDQNQPDYMNYGGLGCTIAHEITHSLTFRDFPWDEYGMRMRWWTSDDQDQYANRAECFIEQYQNVTGNSDLFEAQLKLTENLADTEAAKISFKAYTTWKNKNVKRESHHLLNHTDEQLFWITAAASMCSKSSAEIDKIYLLTERHATEKLRVNMQMINSVDFAKSFNCPEGSRMNPVKKCSFW